jgi:hypothetical protein
MNKVERMLAPGTQAELRYHHGEFKILRQGTYVTCAVTGLPIPLEDLKYWSVERQEAYVGPDAALRRLQEIKAASVTF